MRSKDKIERQTTSATQWRLQVVYFHEHVSSTTHKDTTWWTIELHASHFLFNIYIHITLSFAVFLQLLTAVYKIGSREKHLLWVTFFQALPVHLTEILWMHYYCRKHGNWQQKCTLVSTWSSKAQGRGHHSNKCASLRHTYFPLCVLPVTRKTLEGSLWILWFPFIIPFPTHGANLPVVTR